MQPASQLPSLSQECVAWLCDRGAEQRCAGASPHAQRVTRRAASTMSQSTIVLVVRWICVPRWPCPAATAACSVAVATIDRCRKTRIVPRLSHVRERGVLTAVAPSSSSSAFLIGAVAAVFAAATVVKRRAAARSDCSTWDANICAHARRRRPNHAC